jgi:beta-phosphoglucomutase-like phosphatase (HAD superfamily)
MPLRAVLLDLDGLIADTEPLQVEALRAAVAPLGVTLSDDYVAAKIVGVSDAQNARDIVADFGLEVAADAILDRKERQFLSMVAARPPAPMPGLWEFLDAIRPRLERVGVVTSSKADAVDVVLRGIRSSDGGALASHFDLVVTGTEVAAVKPAPDLYRLALAWLALPAGDCLALEDSAAGVQATRAAGVRCIAVPNGLTRGQDFAAAWQVCASLAAAAATIASLLAD